jgi:TonB family protein
MPLVNRPVLLPLALVCVAGWAAAQTAILRPDGSPPEDPVLRAEAVRLLERANHLSTPSLWPANEMTLRFRVAAPAPGDPFDGEYVSSVGGAELRRQHWRYGAYEYTQIRNGQRLSLTGSQTPQPAVVSLLNEMAPIYLVRFDNQDVIRSIADSSPDTRCIRFDTVTGDRLQSNAVCVDPRNGWLLSVRTGDTLTRNSNFFPFQGSFLPGHIERWSAGRKVIELDETVVLKSDYPEDYFTVPESSTGFICQQFRRAFEVNTPQPPPGSSIQITDIRLQGLIDTNGRVLSLKPIESSHPDLNEEAIKLVSTWTYQPATCEGKTVTWGTTFTVHFKGR